MDAYAAVICLHNLGYQLKALEGDQVAMKPGGKAEHAEMIRAILKEPKAACRAIQYLPQLCMVIMPAMLKEYAADLFSALKENEQAQIVAVRYSSSTEQTEWIFLPEHEIARRTMQDILGLDWGVVYLECKEEGQRG